MEFKWTTARQQRLAEFLEGVGSLLGNDGRRASFAKYAMGLLSSAERKSMEPIAVQCEPCVVGADAAHQRIQQFITDSNWDDAAIRGYAAQVAIKAMTASDKVATWIIDDTGFLKQGKHSVGVQRQYTGSAGKTANCQTATSLVIATHSWHAAIDFELYLPKSWTEDAAKRKEAKIPDDVVFKTKPEQAIDMIRRAVAKGVPIGVVLADAAYGNGVVFRQQIRSAGLHYAVAVEGNSKVMYPHSGADENVARMSLNSLAIQLASKRRRITWREGTQRDLSSVFATTIVVPAPRDKTSKTIADPVSLLMEWSAEDARVKFYFISQTGLSTKEMVRLVKERYRTEQVYAELKGELGLDHFEGRRYRGWHHHVSVVLACQLFLVAERSLFLMSHPSDDFLLCAPRQDLFAISLIPSQPQDLPSLVQSL
jgi:SRSO17 transposase